MERVDSILYPNISDKAQKKDVKPKISFNERVLLLGEGSLLSTLNRLWEIFFCVLVLYIVIKAPLHLCDRNNPF